MKQILSIALFCLISFAANAQFNKGCVMLGGTAGYNKNSVEGEDAGSEFNLSPTVGYFFTSKIAVGAGISFSSYSISGESASTYAINPFGRYYFAGNEKSAFFGQVGLALLKIGEDLNGTGFQVGAGADIFLNESVALEGVLSYQSAKIEEAKFSNFGVNFGIQAFLHRDAD